MSEWGRGGGGYQRRREGLLREHHQGGSHSVQQQVDTFPDFIPVLGGRDMGVSSAFFPTMLLAPYTLLVPLPHGCSHFP